LNSHIFLNFRNYSLIGFSTSYFFFFFFFFFCTNSWYHFEGDGIELKKVSKVDCRLSLRFGDTEADAEVEGDNDKVAEGEVASDTVLPKEFRRGEIDKEATEGGVIEVPLKRERELSTGTTSSSEPRSSSSSLHSSTLRLRLRLLDCICEDEVTAFCWYSLKNISLSLLSCCCKYLIS